MPAVLAVNHLLKTASQTDLLLHTLSRLCIERQTVAVVQETLTMIHKELRLLHS